MEAYESSAMIDADAASVWETLTEVERYPAWDSGVVSVDGTVAQGARLKLVSEANPKRAFALRVREIVPAKRMTWVGGMPLGLFRGVRTYSLEPQGAATQFRMREEYSGPLLRMIWRSMPDLQPSFDKFASGLKHEVERKEREDA